MKITEFRKLIREEVRKVLKEENQSSNVLTQEDFDTLENKGFEIHFTTPNNHLFWIERKYGLPKADFRYLNNLLQKKNIPFKIEYWRGDGDKGQSKEIWIDTKYTNVDGNVLKENEDSEYVPYQFDDQRGKELYLKYNKAFENPAWKSIDGNYEKEIKLNTLLKITGLSLSELQELNSYGDESWKLYIDQKTNTVTEFNN